MDCDRLFRLMLGDFPEALPGFPNGSIELRRDPFRKFLEGSSEGVSFAGFFRDRLRFPKWMVSRIFLKILWKLLNKLFSCRIPGRTFRRIPRKILGLFKDSFKDRWISVDGIL